MAKRDLEQLDLELKRIATKAGGQSLLVSHPVYQYLARAYGLELHSLLWEPDVFPAEPEWQQLQRLAAEWEASWMIWEAEPLAESVERLSSMGIGSIVFTPAANVPPQGDFLSVMQNNLKQLERVFLNGIGNESLSARRWRSAGASQHLTEQQ